MPTSRSFVIYCQIAFFAASPNGVLAQAGTAAPPAATATETPAVVADGNSAETLLGKPVESEKGENLGRIVDVIVDRSGMVQAAIIDFGGFLGVGTRKIAVDWHALHFPQAGGMDKLIADLRQPIAKAPVYKEGEPVVIMGRRTPRLLPPHARLLRLPRLRLPRRAGELLGAQALMAWAPCG